MSSDREQRKRRDRGADGTAGQGESSSPGRAGDRLEQLRARMRAIEAGVNEADGTGVRAAGVESPATEQVATERAGTVRTAAVSALGSTKKKATDCRDPSTYRTSLSLGSSAGGISGAPGPVAVVAANTPESDNTGNTRNTRRDTRKPSLTMEPERDPTDLSSQPRLHAGEASAGQPPENPIAAWATGSAVSASAVSSPSLSLPIGSGPAAEFAPRPPSLPAAPAHSAGNPSETPGDPADESPTDAAYQPLFDQSLSSPTRPERRRGSREQTPVQRALGLLTRREHSRKELTRKLTSRGLDREEVVAAVDRLSDAGWQNDGRFAESLIRSRAGNGYGPVHIRAELGLHGLDSEAIARALASYEGNWLQNARDLVRRRFGEDFASDPVLRRKAADLLLRRGFDGDTARNANRSSAED